MGTLHSSRAPVSHPPKMVPTVLSDFADLGVVDCGWKAPYTFVKTHVLRKVTYDYKKHMKGIYLVPNYAMVSPPPLYVPDHDSGKPIVPTHPSPRPSPRPVTLKQSAHMRACVDCLPLPAKGVFARYG